MKARLPQGYGGGGAQNMNQMIRQAQKVQEQMQQKQEELNEREFRSASGGGAVSVTMTGKKELVSVSIKPEVVDPEDIEMLEDLIIAAVNGAIREVEETSAEELGKITGGMNIPGMM